MTSFDLEEREHREGQLRLVEVSGELDLTNAPELEVRLAALARGDGVVVLDLNRVSFVDSAALHVLFRFMRRRGPERVGIVVDPAAAIARTLQIVGLADLVPVGGTVDEVARALAAIPR